MEKCLSSTPLKIRKYLSNVHKIRDVHLQCVNNYSVRFGDKGMKTVGVLDYPNQTPLSIEWKKMAKFNILIKCAQNIFNIQ